MASLDQNIDAELNILREKLEHDAGDIIKGVSNDDVDWFLRGSIKKSDTESSNHHAQQPQKNEQPQDGSSASVVHHNSEDAYTTNKTSTTNSNGADNAIKRTESNKSVSSVIKKDGVYNNSPKCEPTIGRSEHINVNGVLGEKNDAHTEDSRATRQNQNSALHSEQQKPTAPASSLRRSRSSSLSNSNNNSNSSGSGFFSKLSSKFSRKNKNQQQQQQLLQEQLIGRRNSVLAKDAKGRFIYTPTSSANERRRSYANTNDTNQTLNQTHLSRTMSTPIRSSKKENYSRANEQEKEEDLDPRFEKFLKFYNSKGLSKLSASSPNLSNDTGPGLHQSSEADIPKQPEATRSRTNSISRLLSRTKIDEKISKATGLHLSVNSSQDSRNSNSDEDANRDPKVDALGRPIPPLPPVAPLPPAIKIKHDKSSSSQDPEPPSSPKTSGIFGSFLKRYQSIDHQPPQQSVNNDSRSRNFSGISKSSLSSASSSSSSIESSIDEGLGSLQSLKANSSAGEIPGFSELPVLKRVTFSEKVFFNDPPQQIASRNPRKGEVEVLKNGAVVIQKLTPEERKKILQQGSGGVVVGGFSRLRAPHQVTEAPVSATPETPQVAPDAGIESETTIDKKTAAAAVEKTTSGNVVKPPAKAAVSAGSAAEAAAGVGAEEDVEDAARLAKVKSISIDKPMISRNRSSSSIKTGTANENGDNDDDDDEISGAESSESINKLMLKRIPLDVLYTRCCHLREILPIKSTLKQIPKNSTAPLTNIKFKNPLPSLIEIITFSDFISIAPITSITIDGVSLSFEMFRTILASLAYKTDLEKITFRNTTIDEKGWKLLCWFLTKNKTLKSLDLTQCASLVVLNQTSKKSKSAAANASIVRMEANKENRSDMDWSLFAATLILRGGIEDLVLTGCKIPNLKVFAKLFELALSVKTSTIGLAYNELTVDQMKIVCDWFYKNSGKILGIDLGYNNLNDDENGVSRSKIFIDTLNRINKHKKFCALKYLSMNSTDMYEDAKSYSLPILLQSLVVPPSPYGGDSFDSAKGEYALAGKVNSSVADFRSLEASSFILNLSKLPGLKFLDLSGNARYFKHNIESFVTFLPLLSNLTRLHLEYNELSSLAVTAICESLLACKNIFYLSFMGNDLDNNSYLSLCNLIKNSRIISIELDYDKVPSNINRHIGIYTMRNMERVIYGNKKIQFNISGSDALRDGDDDDNLISSEEQDDKGEEGDGNDEQLSLSSLADECLLFFFTYPDLEHVSDDEKVKVKATVFKFLDKIYKVKSKLDETIEKLIDMRIKHQLNIEGKETLIRFCFIDSSLNKVLRILSEKHGQYVKEHEAQQNIHGAPKSETAEKIAHDKKLYRGLGHKPVSSYSHRVDEEEDDDEEDEDDYNGEYMSNLSSPQGGAGKNGSHVDLRKLDQEEGTIMKASTKLRAKIKEQEDLKIDAEGDTHNEEDHHHEVMLKNFDLDSDKIKEALLDTTKLGNIISTLDQLKEKGILLEDVFKKKGLDQVAQNTIEGKLDLNDADIKAAADDGAIPNRANGSYDHDAAAFVPRNDGRLNNISNDAGAASASAPASASSAGANGEKSGEESNGADDEAKVDELVIKAYDNLVDNLVRVRSRQA